MSVPSTITATLPPPHKPHYGYNNHQNYQNGGFYGSSSYGSARIAPSYNTFPSTQVSVPRTSTNSSTSRQLPTNTMPVSQSTSAGHQASKKRERQPDWDEFYKNGPPKEIIVIDDDSPGPAPPPRRNENERFNPSNRSLIRSGTNEHANKKRRTGQAPVLDSIKYQQASYSNARSDFDTGSNTISTDRTMSLQTTAPTSLGSHTSNGSRGAYIEEAVVGQKRKRVTRQQTAEEKKRKEIEVVGDAYSSYVPPPKPPIKAKDVHVPHVKDVRPIRPKTVTITDNMLEHNKSSKN